MQVTGLLGKLEHLPVSFGSCVPVFTAARAYRHSDKQVYNAMGQSPAAGTFWHLPHISLTSLNKGTPNKVLNPHCGGKPTIFLTSLNKGTPNKVLNPHYGGETYILTSSGRLFS